MRKLVLFALDEFKVVNTLRSKLLKGHIVLVSLAVLWVCSIAGFGYLIRYDMEEGSTGVVAAGWPSQTPLSLEGQGNTLVVFLHPQCPCSMATVTELAKVVDHYRAPLKIYADIANSYLDSKTKQLKCVGESQPGATRLVKYVSEIPGVQLVSDPDSKIATAFGAETSGYTMLYNQHGKLLFAGGITSSRGHEGDNDSADSLIAALKGESNRAASAPVFGCRL
ncbi:MAG TPA: hypothetical protein V6C97_20395 [Oculatellaceae cyanobacterium]